MNLLTAVASASYKDFVVALLKYISESLSARPFFTGQVFKTAIIEHLTDDRVEDKVDFDIFAAGLTKHHFSKAGD